MPKFEYIGNVLRINAPEWYKREDFQAWLNNPSNRIATWHEMGLLPDETSDVFVTIDDQDGSNSDMPADIWAEICEMAKAHNVDEGLVWISNLEE